MSNARIIKKQHTRYLPEFFVEVSQDPVWVEKLQALQIEDKLNTSEAGFPEEFLKWFPEATALNLEFCIERINLADVPRAASCWWPIEENTAYFMAYPAQFPQASVYMAIDFSGDAHECCGQCDH